MAPLLTTLSAQTSHTLQIYQAHAPESSETLTDDLIYQPHGPPRPSSVVSGPPPAPHNPQAVPRRAQHQGFFSKRTQLHSRLFNLFRAGKQNVAWRTHRPEPPECLPPDTRESLEPQGPEWRYSCGCFPSHRKPRVQRELLLVPVF